MIEMEKYEESFDFGVFIDTDVYCSQKEVENPVPVTNVPVSTVPVSNVPVPTILVSTVGLFQKYSVTPLLRISEIQGG